MPHWSPERLAARMPFLDARARMTAQARAWLAGRGLREVETPCLVPAPGMEVHLRGFRSDYRPLDGGAARPLWLRTSPEMALKRLLAGGSGPVFEFARVWRNGEAGRTHAPEFTLLEWYRPGWTLEALMDETEALVRALCPHPACAGPFRRITCAEAFERWAGLDLLASIRPDGTGDPAALGAKDGEGWEDAFFRLLLDHVEPRMAEGAATFLTHWPTPQAALARRDPGDARVALRFELYAGGMELANAFDELTDEAEQRRRFAQDVAERLRLHGADEAWPADEDFLRAVGAMPAGSGIALGWDRLVMLATGARRIEDVLWLGPFPYG
ncbi:EF-P lysine aminoacylase EpmA [Roseococcus sp. DSY-14]|uniref:EF-P lysine aminoacylase EpmA n=1 Tax=Roseococcus sp. DSY-14 TaxID=3369650 RepID=UPI00387B69CD